MASSASTKFLLSRIAPLLASCALLAAVAGCAGSGSLDAVTKLLGPAEPGERQTMATGLRAVGFGKQVDELELAMNRSAEQASAEATEVFWQGIRQMSFADARAILSGGDTAATAYFERTTREPLRERFEPIVAERMRSVGLARLYSDLVTRYAALPFTEKPTLDLEG